MAKPISDRNRPMHARFMFILPVPDAKPELVGRICELVTEHETTYDLVDLETYERYTAVPKNTAIDYRLTAHSYAHQRGVMLKLCVAHAKEHSDGS